MAPPAFLVRSETLARQGDVGGALAVLREVGKGGGEDAARALPGLAALLERLHVSAWHPAIEADLLACLASPHVDPQRLARFAAAMLLAKHPRAEIEAAADDALWVAFLTQCINVDPAMEARLVAMRALLLERGDTRSPLLPALALQAFAGEYVWSSAPPADGPFAVLDAPLAALDLDVPDEGLWRELTRRSRDALATERRLAEAMPHLQGGGSRRVSAAVRRHYEAHPYPRWRAPPAPRPRDLRAQLAGMRGIDSATVPDGPLAVLVAGCGTGYEAIDLARTDASLTITALDLSRASLAYGQRQAEALGVANIRFVRGDLLDLGDLGARFDLVTSTGVLHHLARPEDGLASLARATKPGGIVRLALYSRRARAPVRAAHALIRARGWPPTAEGIRAFRTHVLALPAGDPLAVLRGSDDFYSLSGCRDLVFHGQEQHYALPEIAAMIARAGLRFAALDAPPPALAAFRAAFGPDADPNDLMLWDRLEARHPFLFAGMFQLLCQKPVQAVSGAR